MTRLQPREREVKTLPARSESAPEKPVVVLIVEDHFEMRSLAASYLRQIGYRVIEAENAAEGMSVFCSGTHVDIVFSDVYMQGDLNGHAFARWLAECRPSVPMLLTSAMPNEAQLISAGTLRHFIAKPYHLDEVDWQIQTMLCLASLM